MASRPGIELAPREGGQTGGLLLCARQGSIEPASASNGPRCYTPAALRSLSAFALLLLLSTGVSGTTERYANTPGARPFAQASQAGAATQPADRFVTVNGLRIHYVDWGNETRPPLIMVHGLDRVARTFDHVATHFRSRYHVLAVDMRGHGDSDWHPE